MGASKAMTMAEAGMPDISGNRSLEVFVMGVLDEAQLKKNSCIEAVMRDVKY